jgi:anti-sigma factor RsiW
LWRNNEADEELAQMSEPRGKSAQQRELWRRWIDLAGTGASEEPDEMALAAYAEGRLDLAAAEAVEAYLAAHPEVAEDVAAARGLAGAALPARGAELAAAIARASALVPGSGDRVIAFAAIRPAAPRWRFAAQWTALAASLAMVSYLGFALGSDASSNLAALDQRRAGLADELLDPPTGFLGGITEVNGT